MMTISETSRMSCVASAYHLSQGSSVAAVNEMIWCTMARKTDKEASQAHQQRQALEAA
jgi:hypothetical protein